MWELSCQNWSWQTCSPKCCAPSHPSDLCLKLSSSPWALVEFFSGPPAGVCKGAVSNNFVAVFTQSPEGMMLCPSHGTNQKKRPQDRTALALTWSGTRCSPYKTGKTERSLQSDIVVLCPIPLWMVQRILCLHQSLIKDVNTSCLATWQHLPLFFLLFGKDGQRGVPKAVPLYKEAVFLVCAWAR